jgi:hypothetical protein
MRVWNGQNYDHDFMKWNETTFNSPPFIILQWDLWFSKILDWEDIWLVNIIKEKDFMILKDKFIYNKDNIKGNSKN